MLTRLTLLFALTAAAASAQVTLYETGGTFRTDATNLAPSATAIGLDQLDFGTHYITNINNGTYGNASSWIGVQNDSAIIGTWVGVRFASAVNIASFAFGRDNTGTFTDRTTSSNYLIQYTTDATVNTNPAAATWVDVVTLPYFSSPPALPSQRHLYNINTPLSGVLAFRIATSGGINYGNAIDELEVYSTAGGVSAVPEPSTYAAFAGLAALGLVAWRRRAAARA